MSSSDFLRLMHWINSMNMYIIIVPARSIYMYTFMLRTSPLSRLAENWWSIRHYHAWIIGLVLYMPSLCTVCHFIYIDPRCLIALMDFVNLMPIGLNCKHRIAVTTVESTHVAVGIISFLCQIKDPEKVSVYALYGPSLPRASETRPIPGLLPRVVCLNQLKTQWSFYIRTNTLKLYGSVACNYLLSTIFHISVT